MEEISKKDLLILTGISYGQLYRWKRKGLIPEEWFIKRASFTGQETYFPKDLILDRIDKILELKDDVSLEDLSDIINNKKSFNKVKIETLNESNLFINSEIITLDYKDTYTFEDIVILKLIDNIYDKVNNKEQIKEFYNYLSNNSTDIINNYKLIYLMTKDDKLTSILVKDTDNLEFNIENIIKVNITNLVDNIKLIVMF